jgi:CheY-like chemotaxis protein
MSSRPQFDIRVLLVEPDAQLRAARAKALVAAGYRVSALGEVDGTPQSFAPHLYDVIILSADHGRALASLDWCRRLNRRKGPPPVVVLLANSRVAIDFVPSLVISERTESAIEKKLFAFLAARQEVPFA